MKRTLSNKSKSNGFINYLTEKRFTPKNIKIPHVLVDLIFKYVDTKKCLDCGFVDNEENWLINNPYPYLTDIELHCPDCNKKCDECRSVYFEENTQIIYCDNEEKNERVICNCCLESKQEDYFYCEVCEDYKCQCNFCEFNNTCEDCETKYCDACFNEGKIMWCDNCETKSCCTRFYKINSKIIGGCCLKNIYYPHRAHHLKFK